MARERLLVVLRELSHRLRTSILMAKIRRMSKTTRGKMKLRMLLLMLKQSQSNWGDYYISNRRQRRQGYGFASELQYEEFSASSTPLMMYRSGRRGRDNYLHSLLLLCRPACLGGLEKGNRDAGGRLSIGSSTTSRFPDDAVWWAEQECDDDYHSGAMVEWKGDIVAAASEEEEEEEDGTVDEKAERFIERFYQEMRLQTRQSV